jgi:CheY-like chemotaxis protein
LSGIRVVVVDDDDDTLDYFTVALRAYGAVVAAASNAVDALQLIHDGPMDIVLSDIAMPDHDGYWLVRKLRDSPDPQLRELPVIATTAYGSEHPRRRTLGAGFTEHLPKPVDPTVLRDTIARLTGRM